MNDVANKTVSQPEHLAYYQLRRAQSRIAMYQNFGPNDLSSYLERDAFCIMAKRLASHFFHKSANLSIFQQVQDLYLAELVIAPILQRIPRSMKFDMHAGHVLSWIRTNIGGKINRCHYGCRQVERKYTPDLLTCNLESLGIHDPAMTDVLQDLYRRHACGSTLRHQLAHQIFDPIFLSNSREGFELRVANRLLRLEREPFQGSIDLRQEQANVLNFTVAVRQHHGGRHLEILISPVVIRSFREKVKQTLSLRAPPEYKLQRLECAIQNFAELTRPARSALGQVEELKRWLADKLKSFSSTSPGAKAIPNRFLNQWLCRVDSKLYVKKPNFFLDRDSIEERTYVSFFSPYREVF